MPCNEERLGENADEKLAAKLLAVKHELEHGKLLLELYYNPYDSRVYANNAAKIIEQNTPLVCALFQTKSDDQIRFMSPQAQLWWDEHKRADAERVNREYRVAKQKRTHKDFLAQLSPYERGLIK